MEAVCSELVVLPGLLAAHELTIVSVETDNTAVWTVTTVLHRKEETYVTAVWVQDEAASDMTLC